MDYIARIKSLIAAYEEGVMTERECLFQVAEAAYQGSLPPAVENCGSQDMTRLFDSVIQAGNRAFGYEEK